ncbi:MAG: hypothetical protein JW934_02820 [Anaerolineae bacterium]|nr:hypothetical protein [Anaerolineae bacterium]
MTESTLEVWRRLYELAAAIKALAPWEWLTETEVFGVQDPQTGQLGFVSVMGQLGDHFSVAVYQGAEGLYGLWLMEEMAESLSPEVLLQIPQLQLSFEDRDILTQRDRDLIKSLGLKFRGRNAWPMFRSYRPGFMPWHLDKDEMHFLTLVLEQALDILPRIRQNTDMLEPESEESEDYLVRTARKQGQDWVWQDQIMAVPSPEPEPIQLLLDEVALRRLQRLPLTAMAFEIDIILSPSPIQEHRDDRPKLAFLLLIVDHDSGMVLGSEVLVADPTPESMWGQVPLRIVKTLDRLSLVPQQVWAKNPVLLQMLGLLAQQLHFDLYEAEELPMLDEAQSFLLDRFL